MSDGSPYSRTLKLVLIANVDTLFAVAAEPTMIRDVCQLFVCSGSEGEAGGGATPEFESFGRVAGGVDMVCTVLTGAISYSSSELLALYA